MYSVSLLSGRPESKITWYNGPNLIETKGGVTMGKHVMVNRLEIYNVSRVAVNNTYRCQASNTKLAPPVEKSVRLEMLCE